MPHPETHTTLAAQTLAEIKERASRGPNPDVPLNLAARDRLVLLALVDQLIQEKEDAARSMRDRAAQEVLFQPGTRAPLAISEAIAALPLFPDAEPEPPAATFHLCAEHVTLLRHQSDRDPHAKRPYGSSDVPRDVACILNWHTDVDEDPVAREGARELHHETGTALEVILSAGTTAPGVYHQDQAGTWYWAGTGDRGDQ